LRCRLWNQVLDQRATMIQSVARGFLVRMRMMKLFAKVIMIQHAYRHWRSKPKNFRRKKNEEMKVRKEKAALIQQQYKKHAEQQQLKEINKSHGSAISVINQRGKSKGNQGLSITSVKRTELRKTLDFKPNHSIEFNGTKTINHSL